MSKQMNNFEQTKNWLIACGKEPNTQNASTQIGCDLEEIAEYLKCLRVSKEGWARLLERLVVDLDSLATEIKKGDLVAHIPTHLRVDALDALCDREVTANGVAYMHGFDKVSADNAVLDSNDSKLEDGKPVILDGGKIGKGKNYKKPDLRGFV